jgi:hypothetical protein
MGRVIKLRPETLSVLSLPKLFGNLPAAADLDDDEWRREPTVQVHQERIGEVYESAPRMRWTSEPPTHEGLWFVRAIGGPTRIVEITRVDGALVFGWTDLPQTPVPSPLVRDSGLEWSERAVLPPLEPPGS